MLSILPIPDRLGAKKRARVAPLDRTSRGKGFQPRGVWAEPELDGAGWGCLEPATMFPRKPGRLCAHHCFCFAFGSRHFRCCKRDRAPRSAPIATSSVLRPFETTMPLIGIAVGQFIRTAQEALAKMADKPLLHLCSSWAHLFALDLLFL